MLVGAHFKYRGEHTVTQLAKLFLRGSLVNQTMRNLSPKQQAQVEEKMNYLLQNSALFKCRETFCRVLSNTIGNEYKDRDIALSDYMVALWRAVVSALFHKPTPIVFIDMRQQEKFFKTWVYKYMKQILNENKIPTAHASNKVQGPAHTLALNDFCAALEQNNIEHHIDYDDDDDEYIIKGKISTINKKTAERFGNMISKYQAYGVIIHISPLEIRIITSKKTKDININISTPSYVRMTPFESDVDDHDLVRHNIEYKLQKEANVSENLEEDDRLFHIRQALPDDLRDVFDLIVSTPDAFVDRYGNGIPHKQQIAEFLDIPPQEASKRMDKLKIFYCCSS